MTREKAIKEIEDRIQTTEYVGGSYVDCVDIEALRMAVSALQQPEPKKGRWTNGHKMMDYPRVPYEPWLLYCSECGTEALYSENDERYFLTDFCPNCGADMREGDG